MSICGWGAKSDLGQNGQIPVWPCRRTVPINQHKALVNSSSDPRSWSCVVSRAGYGSHSHLLQEWEGGWRRERESAAMSRPAQSYEKPLKKSLHFAAAAYLQVIQADANVCAHPEERGTAWLVQQNVNGDFAHRTRLLKILKDIQVCQGIGNYGDHLQRNTTKREHHFLSSAAPHDWVFVGLRCKALLEKRRRVSVRRNMWTDVPLPPLTAVCYHGNQQ